MLQQDYIMRLIREFFKALEKLLGKNDPAYQKEAIKDMYKQYVGDSTFFQTATLEEVMKEMGKYDESERIHRLEMLAELYYVDAGLRVGPMSDELLTKALALFRFIDSHSRTFSFDRKHKIADIEQRLYSTIPPDGSE